MQVDIEKIIPVTEARDSFNKIVDEVEGSDELYVLTKNGKPAAVVAGVNHLEKLTGESATEVMAKVESQPEEDAIAPSSPKPFQVNNYDSEPVAAAPAEPIPSPVEPTPAPAMPADTAPVTPPPAPEPAPEATPATPDTSTPAEPAYTPQRPGDKTGDVGPESYDPFKIPEDAPANSPAESAGTVADAATPPPAATDSAASTPPSNTPPAAPTM